MFQVLKNTWALLLGMALLMLGNGLQGSLLGVRGEAAGFTTFELSLIMSAYFIGFLGGSRLTPELIRRVGHVRVFAALASFISAVLILYPAFQNPYLWIAGRVLIGFCFSGVYVTAESWLNNSVNNDQRGQALSLYMMVQMIGIVAAQGLLNIPDASGFLLFIIPSVLVSISFAPILLSISPTPAFEATKPLTLRQLFKISPLGFMGMLLLGSVFSAQFGMAAVFGAEAGLSLAQISIFVSAFYIGATVLQYPLGWLSDRMDRRVLICAASALGGAGALLAFAFGTNFTVLLVGAFLIGGMSNPLYSLLLAYTNDFLDFEDMAAASGGLVFVNGLGAIAGPLVTGWLMSVIGPYGYFTIIAALLLALAGYAAYRMTQRPSPTVDETSAYTPVMPTASVVAVEAAQEYSAEMAEDAENDGRQ
ncbi:MFS transporter [Lutimaribacter saemankumensis]|uniref:Predicted arabinose efflux permease, MFS family n=1 Tax=Lutimaribacter saemankumensis TaxID=490829 RepID=A0A1G8GR65_9RHOB|nr:MFS transporter [Lutimaribacter saemankumensis]SDH96790.1 Predicted arabinose efflux permease, MFS family [Lutimaribacter saemankumensis]